MNNETIEQKAIKLISKYSPWLKENLLIEEHLYEFDDVAGLIELAIAEEREAFGWRDIASAPKDGTHILLGRCGTDEDCEISTLGWWQEEFLDGEDYMGSDAGFVDHDFNSFHPGRSFGADIYQYKAVQPTHWKHLPAAPKDEAPK